MSNIYELIEKAEANERDNQAIAAGFMVGVTGEVYTKSLSVRSAVYIDRIGDEWQAWRETYRTGDKRAVSFKIIAKDKRFAYVLGKAKSYFDFIERKRGRK